MQRSGILIATILFSSTLLAQSPTPPPVKMGLWQSTNTVKMTGLQIPPEVAARLKEMGRPVPGAEPHTMVLQSCLTPDKWQKMFTDMQQKKDCKYENLHQDSAGLSVDIACRDESGENRTTGYVDMRFDSMEKMHGTGHIEATVPSQPNPVIADMNFESVYQGSDCQGISPDSPKVIKQ